MVPHEADTGYLIKSTSAREAVPRAAASQVGCNPWQALFTGVGKKAEG